MRVRLAREVAGEHAAAGGVELDAFTKNDGGVAVPRQMRTSKVHEHYSSIDKLTARIESLEKTRMVLGGATTPVLIKKFT